MKKDIGTMILAVLFFLLIVMNVTYGIYAIIQMVNATNGNVLISVNFRIISTSCIVCDVVYVVLVIAYVIYHKYKETHVKFKR